MAPRRTDRTELTRLREKARTDRADLDALLDSCVLGHFGVADDDGRVVVVPTGVARDGDRILAHGSTGSGWMRTLSDGRPTCLTVTALDGVVVARSAFESSLHYRSAVLFGSCRVVTDRDDKQRCLDLMTERLLPGRTAEIRASTKAELAATLVLAMTVDEWSLKVSDKWPEDPDDDVAGPAWAGVVPLGNRFGEPRPAPDLRAGIDVPDSVRRFTAQPPGLMG